MDILIYIMGAIVATAIITWLLFRSLMGKSNVSTTEHRELAEELMRLKTELGIKTGLYEQAMSDCQGATVRTDALQKALNEEGRQHAAVIAECVAATNNLSGAIIARDLAINDVVSKSTALHEADKTIARLTAENKNWLKKLEEQQAFVAEMKSSMEREFKLIANATLDENSRKITEQQKEKLETTLQPFREQIDAFRKQVDEKFTAEVADRNTLKGELSRVFTLANQLTDQTNKLTNALTTQTKAQGNYGEAILETILTNAGMIEGEHYEKQFNTTNDAGQRVIPDIVMHAPDGYSVVIDAKMSLTHYMRYCNDTLTPEEEKAVRKDIWQSFKNHIDGLSGKRYESIANCADFVLMFAPVESAFTVAAQHDNNIRNYAFERKVFLVTPSNLLLVVKMIGDLWQKDRVNKDAQAMADRARMLYDKACTFLESFTAMGAALDKAKSEWNAAASRLTGNGGLVSQGKILQKLVGQKSNKSIPASLLTEAALANGIELPETTSAK